MRKRDAWVTVILMALGWGISWGVVWGVDSVLAYAGVQFVNFPGPKWSVSLAVVTLAVCTLGIGWGLGGWSTGLILGWRYAAFRAKQTLLVAGGWLASGIAGFPVLFVLAFSIGFAPGLSLAGLLIGDNSALNMLALVLVVLSCGVSFVAGVLLSGALVGGIGSMITGLALRWSMPTARRARVLSVIIAWATGLTTAWLVGWIISGLAWWALLGAWGGDLGILDLVLLGLEIGPAIALFIGGALGGMVGGSLGGGIGGALIVWQFEAVGGRAEQRGLRVEDDVDRDVPQQV